MKAEFLLMIGNITICLGRSPYRWGLRWWNVRRSDQVSVLFGSPNIELPTLTDEDRAEHISIYQDRIERLERKEDGVY